jgi:DinB superfamily
MKQTAQTLRDTLNWLKPLLLKIKDKEASIKPAPKKWSKKEIIGHLIDSAANNQQKFVRLLTSDEPHIEFVGYAQDDWVAVQRYQKAKWKQLVRSWYEYNMHIAHIIEYANPKKLSHTIAINGVGAFRLDFIMTDYVEHLKHHIKAVLPDADIESAFSNVYNA